MSYLFKSPEVVVLMKTEWFWAQNCHFLWKRRPKCEKSIRIYVSGENPTFWAILEANMPYTYAENANIWNFKEVK